MAIVASSIFVIIGLFLILGFLYILIRNGKIKRNGILTTAKVVSISLEKGSENEEGFSGVIKVPVYSFEYYKNGNLQSHRIKGRSNSKVEIGDVTPVYYNPKNPPKDYYLPKKDFFIKYVFLVIGFGFFAIGISKGFDFYSNYFYVFGIPNIDKEGFFIRLFFVFLGFILWSSITRIINNLIFKKKNKAVDLQHKNYKESI
ncbi:uncharacterized protein DUF3592 [Cellulophaga sp. RHA19]|nr:uncharacterized protein DUF3592 [Cellulophaga sp. RHA19]